MTRLKPEVEEEKNVLTNIVMATHKLEIRAEQRKKQADKREVTPVYEED